MRRLTAVLSTIFTLSLLSIPSLSSTEDFLFGGCTQLKYSPNSPYESNLNSLLTSLVNSATYSSYNNFTTIGSSPQDVVYGLFQCRGDLSMPDCATCITGAVSRVRALCSESSGGALQLEGCYVKYDNATFLGVEDTTMVLKKCGPSVGYDADAMTLRDAVLDGLEKAGGPYRVGGSGDVQGMAQCVGDLSLGQCQDCLAEAIGRLKSECNMGVYGGLFLAKCYARYSTTGAQVYTNNHHDHNDKSTNEDEKTFAIIIGLIAGVALLVIFITFIGKTFGGNGK